MHFLWYVASIDACKLRNHGTAAEIAPFSWRSALCTCTATNHRNNAHEMRAWVDVSGTPTNGVAQGREGTDLRSLRPRAPPLPAHCHRRPASQRLPPPPCTYHFLRHGASIDAEMTRTRLRFPVACGPGACAQTNATRGRGRGTDGKRTRMTRRACGGRRTGVRLNCPPSLAEPTDHWRSLCTSDIARTSKSGRPVRIRTTAIGAARLFGGLATTPEST